mgnify:CR=1 FL=1
MRDKVRLWLSQAVLGAVLLGSLILLFIATEPLLPKA